MRFEPLAKLMSENTKNGIYKSKDFMGSGTPIVKMSQQFGNRFIDLALMATNKSSWMTKN